MTQLEATLLGVGIASFAFLLGVLTYALSRNLLPLAPTGKLWDRVYELDKLVLAYPKVFGKYMAQVKRQDPYFYAPVAVVPRDDEYYQLKALVYFHLNVFEEIFLTTSRSVWTARQFERAGWEQYIIRKLRHPLMREVLKKEGDLIYAGAFLAFVNKHGDEIKKPADVNAF